MSTQAPSHEAGLVAGDEPFHRLKRRALYRAKHGNRKIRMSPFLPRYLLLAILAIQKKFSLPAHFCRVTMP